ncbi:MAG: sigma factor-like helix-turn-helix DNA-binding protein, partial [Bradyrhizobium sp.]
RIRLASISSGLQGVRVYHEKSVEDVAEIVGIPENTVKTRLFYARKKLAELLKAAGVERGWP